jgi:AcrR family transcriptional regulator
VRTRARVGVVRARIMRAAVQVLAERGFSGVSLEAVIERAGVSRRTFKMCFGSLEGCVGEIMDEALEHSRVLVGEAFRTADGGWRDGLRGALVAMLAFLDAEPALARVTVIESLAGGPVVLAHRKRAFDGFCAMVVGQIEGEIPHAWPLAAECLLAAVLGVAHAHLSGPERRPLVCLIPALMATLVAPFSSPVQLERELRHSETLVQAIMHEQTVAREHGRERDRWPFGYGRTPATTTTGRRAHPRRVHECLSYLAEHPNASNREIATGIGVASPSQISRLLSRLLYDQLAIKHSLGTGKRNAWRITERGRTLLGASER